jgi:hypothetical protein
MAIAVAPEVRSVPVTRQPTEMVALASSAELDTAAMWAIKLQLMPSPGMCHGDDLAQSKWQVLKAQPQ